MRRQLLNEGPIYEILNVDKDNVKVRLKENGYYTLINKKNLHDERVLTDKEKKIHDENQQYIYSLYRNNPVNTRIERAQPLKTIASYVDDSMYPYCQKAVQEMPNEKIVNLGITEYTKHFTTIIDNHGNKNRQFYRKNNEIVGHLLKMHFSRINNNAFKKLESFYFKSSSCYGSYYDLVTSVFEQIQNKIKNTGHEPKCFVKLAKKQYVLVPVLKENRINGEIVGLTFVPFGNKDDKNSPDPRYEDFAINKDKYFDYYYVEKDKIYKVPNKLVKNRVALIESKQFANKFKELQDKGEIQLVVDEKKEFKEFYDFKKEELQQADNQEKEKRKKNKEENTARINDTKKTTNRKLQSITRNGKIIKNIDTNTDPEDKEDKKINIRAPFQEHYANNYTPQQIQPQQTIYQNQAQMPSVYNDYPNNYQQQLQQQPQYPNVFSSSIYPLGKYYNVNNRTVNQRCPKNQASLMNNSNIEGYGYLY